MFVDRRKTYNTYEAEKLGYHSQIILNGRVVNDGMDAFITDTDATVKQLVLAGKAPKKSKVAILGLTFKENCPDTRNSIVADVIGKLKKYGIEPLVVDPWASERDALREYGVELTKIEEIKKSQDLDCIIFPVAHDAFKKISLDQLKKLYKAGSSVDKWVLIDVKSILDKKAVEAAGFRYWRL